MFDASPPTEGRAKGTYAAVIGGVLAEERELRGVTQAAAASAAGLTQSTWARMEVGKACTVENLAKACGAFKLEMWKLIKVADDRTEALRAQCIDVVYEPVTEEPKTVWLAGNELSRIAAASLAASSPLAALAIAAGNGIAGYISKLFENK